LTPRIKLKSIAFDSDNGILTTEVDVSAFNTPPFSMETVDFQKVKWGYMNQGVYSLFIETNPSINDYTLDSAGEFYTVTVSNVDVNKLVQAVEASGSGMVASTIEFTYRYINSLAPGLVTQRSTETVTDSSSDTFIITREMLGLETKSNRKTLLLFAAGIVAGGVGMFLISRKLKKR
jgi:hypothetical protein